MEKIDVGDKVFVAWGLDELPATVREIRGLPHHPFALVDVEIPSTGGDSVDIESVSVPLDALRLRTPKRRARTSTRRRATARKSSRRRTA